MFGMACTTTGHHRNLDGIRHGARGMLGGQDGQPHDYNLIYPDPATPPRKLRTKEVGVEIPSGSVLHVLSGGGGGWGDPSERDPAAREKDRAEGLSQ